MLGTLSSNCQLRMAAIDRSFNRRFIEPKISFWRDMHLRRGFLESGGTEAEPSLAANAGRTIPQKTFKNVEKFSVRSADNWSMRESLFP